MWRMLSDQGGTRWGWCCVLRAANGMRDSESTGNNLTPSHVIEGAQIIHTKRRTIPMQPRAFSASTVTCALILMVTLGLSACASSSSLAGSTPPVATNCGAVSTTLNGHVADATALASENCFAQAFKTCAPATLTFSSHGIDNGTIHGFSLGSQAGKCIITDAQQSYIAPQAPKPIGTVTCTQLQQDQQGVTIDNCSDQSTILIPAPTA